VTSTFVKVSLIVVIILLVGILAVISGFLTTPIGFLTIPGCVMGSGNVESETRTVDTFHSVELGGWGNLYVTQDGISDIRIEAEDNILPLLQTYVSDNVLVIEHEKFKCIRPVKPVNVYVSMEEVKRLSLSGSGKIIGQTGIISDSLDVRVSGSGDIDLEVDTEELKTTISGSGSAQLKGDATAHDVTISGSGNIQSYDLATEKSTIKVFGSGKSEVSVSDDLDVTIAGSGDVYYKGDPANLNTQISGSGKLEKVE